MQLSLTPILVTIELGFVLMLAQRCVRLSPTHGSMTPVYLYLLWVTAYAITTSILGARGVYISDDLLKTLPALWLQLVTVGVAVLPVVLFSGVRDGLPIARRGTGSPISTVYESRHLAPLTRR